MYKTKTRGMVPAFFVFVCEIDLRLDLTNTHLLVDKAVCTYVV